MAKIFLSLGSNLGNREENLKHAIKFLQNLGKIKKTSSIYETEPYGVTGHPEYLNQCVILDTPLSPEDFFGKCRDFEKKMGRERQEGKILPREIDIDILFYDDLVLESDDLVIPHPRLHERKFVLVPLLEITPKKIHPVFKKTIEELLKECEDRSMVKVLE